MKGTVYRIRAYDAVGENGRKRRVQDAVGLDVGGLSPDEAARLEAALRRFAAEYGITLRAQDEAVIG